MPPNSYIQDARNTASNYDDEAMLKPVVDIYQAINKSKTRELTALENTYPNIIGDFKFLDNPKNNETNAIEAIDTLFRLKLIGKNISVANFFTTLAHLNQIQELFGQGKKVNPKFFELAIAYWVGDQVQSNLRIQAELLAANEAIQIIIRDLGKTHNENLQAVFSSLPQEELDSLLKSEKTRDWQQITLGDNFSSQEELAPLEVKRTISLPVTLKVIKNEKFDEALEFQVFTNKPDLNTLLSLAPNMLEKGEDLVAFCNVVPMRNRVTHVPSLVYQENHCRQFFFGLTSTGRFISLLDFIEPMAEVGVIARRIFSHINNLNIEISNIDEAMSNDPLLTKTKNAQPSNTDQDAKKTADSMGLDKLPTSQAIQLGTTEQVGPNSVQALVDTENQNKRTMHVSTTTRILAYNWRKNKPCIPSQKKFEEAQLHGTSLHIHVFRVNPAQKEEIILASDKDYAEFIELLDITIESYPNDEFEIRCETFVDYRKLETEQAAGDIAEKIDNEVTA